MSLMMILTTFFYALQLSPGTFPRPLTEQEERDCLERMARGDREARNILIERNLRLVAHVMKKYYAHSADQEDLISIGTIGLIKAVETFNPTKSTRLATYAARCIENEILVLRLRYGLGGGEPLRQREVADRTGISRSYVQEVTDTIVPCFSFEKFT